MANLSLVYGLRLLPEGELDEVGTGSIKLKNGHEVHVTLHLLEGSKEEIEAQLKESIDAFLDIYPEIHRKLRETTTSTYGLGCMQPASNAHSLLWRFGAPK